MLTDAQGDYLMLLLFVGLLGAGTYGFVQALRDGSMVVGKGRSGLPTETVMRDENPRRFRRYLIWWALLLLIVAGLLVLKAATMAL
ncbi:hypothetical protein P1X14_06820 [Sphingomonas sp. AOB5]|uniref:hypothetical protein n=1 Tax=Sphingomonas sp. AOB5 TaxID=3034017 RepID=UPI0023F80E6E|nr:hypothetical protein [Sphingomonas sp. AOB5]MDF7774950.1 hypothetical protein [Sphingomonas sp. AOB5]